MSLAEISEDEALRMQQEENTLRQEIKDLESSQEMKDIVDSMTTDGIKVAAGMRGSGSIDSLYIRNTEKLVKKRNIALQDVQGKTEGNAQINNAEETKEFVERE